MPCEDEGKDEGAVTSTRQWIPKIASKPSETCTLQASEGRKSVDTTILHF